MKVSQEFEKNAQAMLKNVSGIIPTVVVIGGSVGCLLAMGQFAKIDLLMDLGEMIPERNESIQNIDPQIAASPLPVEVFDQTGKHGYRLQINARRAQPYELPQGIQGMSCIRTDYKISTDLASRVRTHKL